MAINTTINTHKGQEVLTFNTLTAKLVLEGNGHKLYLDNEQIHIEQSTVEHVWNILKRVAA
ncbi:hypothetical protein [Azospirillum sp. sgz301742]